MNRMKNFSISPDENWHTVKPEYGPDSFLNIQSRDITTKDNVQLNLSYFLKNVTDIKTNNHVQLVLTDNIRADNMFTPNIPSSGRYPEQFTTYIKANAFPYVTGRTSFLRVVEDESDSNGRYYHIGLRSTEDPDDTDEWVDERPIYLQTQFPDLVDGIEYNSTLSNIDTEDDNGIYFSITFLDENRATIRHDDNASEVYLTYTGNVLTDNEYFYFATVDESTEEQRTFNYIHNNDTGFLALFKIINEVDANTGNVTSSKTYYIKSVRAPGKKYSLLKFEQALPGNLPVPRDCVFKTVKYKKNTQDLKINNHWVSYSTFGQQNNLTINEKKSFKDVYNNYLFSLPYKQITKETGSYNVLQLKNQLTPMCELSRANPFPNYRACDHREYDKIFSGTNQIGGSDQLSIGYNSYITTIDLEPDKITYFNAPQDMYPLKKININDSGLIEAGAIGGDTPVVSDKIFKKAADYKYNTPYGAPSDEESGVWLCSWLKSNIGTDWDSRALYQENTVVNFENRTYRARETNTGLQPDVNSLEWERIPGGDPVWVDRYYNPNAYSAEQALEIEGQYYDYTSKFEYIIQRFHAEDEYVFDKRSDLTFEPGCLYAYYRIGQKENQSIIDTEKARLVHEGLEPVYYQNRQRFPQLADKVNFAGDTYIETQALNKTTNSDYTVSFNIEKDEWSQPFASQIIGNYTNQGFGLFNKMCTTQYLMFYTQTTIHVMNTDMIPVLTIEPTVPDESTQSIQVLKALRTEGSENIHVLLLFTENSVSHKYIYQYDMKGMLVERFKLPDNVTDIKDISVDHNYYYILQETDNADRVTYQNNIYRCIQRAHLKITPPDQDSERWVLDNDWTGDTTVWNNHYKYEANKSGMRRFNINNEKEDLLFEYKIWPEQPIGYKDHYSPLGSFYQQSSENHLQLNDDNYYEINAKLHTVDLNGDIWFIKREAFGSSQSLTVYKRIKSSQSGARAVFSEMIDGSRVEIVSDTQILGNTQGNTIIITGDGVNTVSTLVARWNDANPGNEAVSITETGDRVIPEAGKEMQLDGGIDRGQDTTIYALSADANHDITSIKTDYENDVWLLCKQTHAENQKEGIVIYKMDTDRRFKFTKTLNDIDPDLPDNFTGNCTMDLIYELTAGDIKQYMSILVQDVNDLTQITNIKVNLDGTLISSESSVHSFLNNTNIESYVNFSNSETLKRLHPVDVLRSNYMIYKFRYQSYFDTDKTYIKHMYYKLTELTKGDHHFAISFNSTNGNLALFVDGELQIGQASDDVFTGAAYKFTKTIHNPLLIGCDAFFNNITLSEYLKQDNQYFIKDCKFSRIRVYNKYLNFHKIRAMTRQNLDIETVQLTLPTGKRSYVDQIVKYYFNRTPGRKSNYFDVNVVSNSITGDTDRETMELLLRDDLQDKLPANIYLNEIHWIT